MIDHILVNFYRVWHGTLKKRGAGRLLSKAAPNNKGLQSYRVRLPEGHFIELDFRDVSAMYWLNHTLGDRFEERGLLTAMRRFLKPESVIWDIGANSGLLSYHLAKEQSFSELHLFEPNPRMAKLATQALSVFPKAEVLPFGLSNREGDFTLTIPDGHTTLATLEPDATHRIGTACRIHCRVGDDLVWKSRFTPPSVIKIDTEGHEPSVIAGLTKTIESHRPVIFCEHISLDTNDVLSMLPSGYRLFTVNDHTGELVEGASHEIGHNSALIP
jgi:FkbM family methyltransferase